MRPTGMPSTRARAGFWAVACMRRPVRVPPRKYCRAVTASTATAMMTRFCTDTTTPPPCRLVVAQAAVLHRRKDEEGGQHDEFALREVDRLRRLPQQHEADGDQRVDAACRQAGESELQNVRQRFTSRPTCPAWAGSGRSSACPRRLRPGS